jgi:hypothetical protein
VSVAPRKCALRAVIVLLFSLMSTTALAPGRAEATATMYFDGAAFRSLLSGSPLAEVDFDDIAPGTDLTNSSMLGMRFEQPNFGCGGHAYRCGTQPSGRLVVIGGIPGNPGLPPSTQPNLLSPGGSDISTCSDPLVDNDDLQIVFMPPVSSFGVDVVFKSPDGASYVGIRILDGTGSTIAESSFIPMSHLVGSAQFVGVVSDAADIATVQIDEYDDNCSNPDEHVGYDSVVVSITNAPPIANAGGPYTVAEGGSVALDASASSDPDGDTLSYSWDLDGDGRFETTGSTPALSAAGRDGPSSVEVGLQVCDPGGLCSTASSTVTVTNVAPVVDAGLDQTVFRNQPVSLSGTFSDPAGELDNPYAWEWDVRGDPSAGTATYGTTLDRSASFATEGDYLVGLAVTDDDGGTGTDAVVVQVLNRPPACAGARPGVGTLWPPDHRFVEVGILGMTDPDSDPVAVAVTSIRQDEPVDARGSGNTRPDARGVGTPTAGVRAERVGGGDGRVYHVGFQATDGHGGVCTGSVRVAVPHDQSGRPAVDDGPLYDSTAI